MKNSSSKLHSLLLVIGLVMLLAQPVGSVLGAAPSSVGDITAGAEPLAVLPRPMLAPAAQVTVTSADVLLGSTFTFPVTFRNSGTVGYGPFVDLIFPTRGVDGAISAPLDGITFVGVTYLGHAIQASDVYVQTFPASGTLPHPLMVTPAGVPVTVSGAQNDTLVTIRLPFGSFVPEQPAVTLEVQAKLSTLADLSPALVIQARGGYQFGATPLNDYCCGDHPSQFLSAWSPASITPTLLTFQKTYNGPEDESATGPNFPRKYTISADLAAGQVFSNFDLVDMLPANLVYLGGLACSAGSSIIRQPPLNVASNPLDNELRVRWASLTGGAANPDVQCSFDFYFPRSDANGNAVVSAVTGNDAPSCNQGQAGGLWQPVDPRDAPASTFTPSALQTGCASPEYMVTAKSIAIQKGVRNLNAPNSPGDILEYTLNVQVSDFFGFNGLVISDIISDGQRFFTSPTLQPSLAVSANGWSLPNSAIPASAYQVNCSYTGAGSECSAILPPIDGSTQWQLDLSAALQDLLPASQGKLLGGCINPATGSNPPDCTAFDDGATTLSVTFYTQIQDQFSDTYPSGDASVDQGDVLSDNVTVDGSLLDITSSLFPPTAQTEGDGSSADVSIGTGVLTKSIYAIKGSTSFSSPVKVYPGDAVTFRLTYTLPTSDFEQLRLNDYLPLPVFDVADADGDGLGGPAWTFIDAGGSVIPAPGEARFGPADTFRAYSGVVPALTANAAANQLTFTYGDFDKPGSAVTTIDLLFTANVSSQPFADGLYLTNQANAFEGSTNSSDTTQDAIVQLQLGEPVLLSKKAVIWSSNSTAVFTPATSGPVTFLDPTHSPRWSGTINSTNLAANPINSNLSGVDGSDIVSFALYVENTGSSLRGAFDLLLRDTLPAGFVIPAGGLNLQVYYGDGSGPISSTGDLFGTGMELVDPVGSGVCSKHDPNLGNNIIMITYDLQVDPTAASSASLVNTGTLANYSGSEGGPDYANPDITDTATVTLAAPLFAKTLTGTEINNTGNNNTQAVIGELVNYSLTVTVPEGQMQNARIVDTLDTGLVFVDCIRITPAAALSTSLTGGFAAACSDGSSAPGNPLISNNGATIAFDLGTISNSNNDNSAAETLVIEYSVVVTNIAANQSGGNRNNSAVLTAANGITNTKSAPNVAIIEPAVVVNKQVTTPPGGFDAGDTVTYTITLTGAANRNAYEVTLNDPIPAVILTPAITAVSDSASLVSAANFVLAGNALSTVTAFDMPAATPARVITVTISGSLAYSIAPGQTVTNTATTAWSSMDGDVQDRSPYNPASDERTGADGVGGALNDYAARGSVGFVANNPGNFKYLVNTSEAATNADRLTIGEIARFRLVVSLPEGSSANFQIREALPDGFTFLDDNTTRLTFVSNGGIASSAVGTVVVGLPGCDTVGSLADASTPAALNCALPDSNSASSASTVTDSDVFTSGADIFFKFGSLVNNDSDGDGEYVVLEFNALLDNTVVGSNDLGDVRQNNFNTLINGSVVGNVSNSVAVTVVEPQMTLTKSALVSAPNDAGAPVQYTVTATNTAGPNSASAFDLNLVDSLPVGLTNVQVSSLTSTQGSTCLGDGLGSTAFVSNSSIVPSSSVTITATCLDAGQSITALITADVAQSALVGSTLNNQAVLTYTSLPGNGTAPNGTGSIVPGAGGTDSGERNGSQTGPNDYRAAANAAFTLDTPVFDKLAPIPATAEIGAPVVFDLNVTLPEGVTTALVVTDALPVGLAYSQYQLITTEFAGSFGNTPPTETIVAGSGGSLSLDFGDVTTTNDNVLANNSFTVRLTALVLDVPGNLDGVSLRNTASMVYTHPVTGRTTLTDQADIALVEPRINTTKTITTLPTDFGVGALVGYTVRFSNTGNASAYDMTAQDNLPVGVAYQTGSMACTGFDGALLTNPLPVTVTDNGSSLLLDGAPLGSWDLAASDPDSYVECTYNVVLQASIPLLGTHQNTIDADWRSQDAAGGRNYADLALNPFDQNQDQASASFSTGGPTIVKDDGGVTEVVVGQVVHYTLTITSETGTLKAVTINDSLPAGMIYVLNSQVVSANLTPGSAAPGFSAVGPVDGSAAVQLTWDLGDAQIASSPVVIEYDARIANAASNQNAQVLSNAVLFNYQQADGTPIQQTGSDSATVTEAVLQLTKQAAALSVTPDAGDLVTYTLTLSHTAESTASAYSVHLVDVLPAATDLQMGSLTITGAGTATVTDLSSDLDNRLEFTISDIPQGSTLTITYQARLTAAVTPAQLIENTAAVTWSSLPGDVNPGAVDGERDGSGGVNDYQTQASAQITTANAVAFAKTLFSSDHAGSTGSDVVIGEQVTYALLVTLSEGSYTALMIEDQLPDGLLYNGFEVITLAANAGGLLTADFGGVLPVALVTGGSTSGEDVQFAFGPLTVQDDNNPDTNSFVVLVTARVENEALNQENQVRTNSATASVNGANGVSGGSVDVTVREPVLTVNKAADSTTPAFQQPVTFTLTLDNLAPASSANAYDVLLQDMLPAGLEYVAGSISAPAGWTADDSALPTLTWRGDLLLGQSAVFTYQAVISTALTPGVTLTNAVRAEWTSLPGDQDTERSGAGGLNDYLQATSLDLGYTSFDLSIVKTASPDPVVPGADLTYNLAYANSGNQPAQGVVIAETIPAHATYSPSNTEAWTCSGTGAGSTCTLALGLLPAFGQPGAEGSVAFIVLVDDPLPGGYAVMDNTARIDDSDANTIDPTPENNASSVQTGIEAAPLLEIVKDDGLTIVAPGASLTYVITVRNTGNQDASGIQVTDEMPAGLTFVSASDGGVFDAVTATITWPVFDLPAASGSNSRQVQVTVTVDAVQLADSITNIARARDDGANTGGVVVEVTTSDTDRLVGSLVKSIIETNQPATSGSNVLIGEILTYQLALEVPPGDLLDLKAVDILDAGLAFVDCLKISPGSLTTTLTGGFPAACSAPGNPSVSAEPSGDASPINAGRKATFNLGSVNNPLSASQVLTITYSVVVLNTAQNQNGTGGLGNSATWTWSGGSLAGSAPDVTIVEPELAITKSVDNPIVPVDGVVTFTLRVAHTAASQAPAYDVLLQDVLPAGLVYIPKSLIIVRGPQGGVASDVAPGTISVRWPVFGLNDQAEVRFQAAYKGPGEVVNGAEVQWSSLPGAQGPQSPYNNASDERSYRPGVAGLNDYRAVSTVAIRQPDELPATGFAPGVVTSLPPQPDDRRYSAAGDMSLEIPAMGLKMRVVGVPLSSSGDWDLTWLTSEAGYLQGTAYPGQVGVTGITGHVYLADGTPGPFLGIDQLTWGNQIIINLNGARYIYEVRAVRTLLPNDLSIFKNDGYAWMTLLTCKQYQASSDSYAYRTAVRAVLVQVIR